MTGSATVPVSGSAEQPLHRNHAQGIRAALALRQVRRCFRSSIQQLSAPARATSIVRGRLRRTR